MRALNILFNGSEAQFAPDACDVWQIDRIPRSQLRGDASCLQWLHGDSEENYRTKGNKAFSAESVSYQFNSLGYRSDEFSQDSSPAFLFLGCSNTLGIGIPHEHLWTTLVAAHFSRKWQTRVKQYNLGWSGTGTDHVAMMVHQSAAVLRPMATFVLWSYANRVTWHPNPNKRVQFLPTWYEGVPRDEHEAYALLSTDANGFFNYVRNYNFVSDRLARLNIPFFCGNLEKYSTRMLAPYVPLDSFVGPWERLDYARDNQHSGILSQARFAQRIIDAAGRTLPQTLQDIAP